jgi:hypothetical protein
MINKNIVGIQVVYNKMRKILKNKEGEAKK